jgi:3-oxoacyl-[acyl-carrier-protein] synthase-1
VYYLNDVGLLCSLGTSREEVAANLMAGAQAGARRREFLVDRHGRRVGHVDTELPELPPGLRRFDCRNNRLALAALRQIRPAVDAAVRRWGAARVAVVAATSTSGIAETQQVLQEIHDGHGMPADYHAIRGAIGGLAEFIVRYLQLQGPACTVSTACSSSANAFLSARRLLRLGLCDAVVVGGVDSLCDLTLRGFEALEALSSGTCRPFSVDRDGINIGEAAALFLLSREAGPVEFLGGAGSSDAFHISAPHPDGEGAFQAMRGALADAGLAPGQIDYLNLHGTGTPQNDAMESKAVFRLFGGDTWCSSTKALTGHTLGAAGALEAAFCWLVLETGQWPDATGPARPDPELPQLRFLGSQVALPVGNPTSLVHNPRYCMSNSFAFGGNNVSLVMGKGGD